MAARVNRLEKERMIFQHFDSNRDGGLNRSEMAALVVAVNPRVKFSDEQINAILDEVFRTYSEFIDGDSGLTLEGLVRKYDDGVGDVDRDCDALGLSIDPSAAHEKFGAAGAKGYMSSSSIVDERRQVESQKKQRMAAWAVSPNHGIVFDDTRKIMDDMEILVKRLKAKQAKEGKLKGDNFGAYSDVGWSRELGPSSADMSEKRVHWDESGHDYAVFVKELGVFEEPSRPSMVKGGDLRWTYGYRSSSI